MPRPFMPGAARSSRKPCGRSALKRRNPINFNVGADAHSVVNTCQSFKCCELNIVHVKSET